MKIYAISGLGADGRVFDQLNLDVPIYLIRWIEPGKEESLEAYALRLSAQVDTNDEAVFIGVSFGGMIAMALNKHIHPLLIILISSVENNDELPFIYKLTGKTGIIQHLPTRWLKPPKRIATWLFRAKEKKIFHAILHDTDTTFVKWAIGAVGTWKEKGKHQHVIRIHGTRDRILPLSKGISAITIANGGHFMIVDKAPEISCIINRILKNLIP